MTRNHELSLSLSISLFSSPLSRAVRVRASAECVLARAGTRSVVGGYDQYRLYHLHYAEATRINTTARLDTESPHVNSISLIRCIIMRKRPRPRIQIKVDGSERYVSTDPLASG
jgi:hypothetical protein